MPTLDEHVRTLETAHEAATTRRNSAINDIKAVLALAKKAGRDHLTADEELAVANGFSRRDEANKQLVDIDRKLTEARKAQAEEEQIAMELREVKPTGLRGHEDSAPEGGRRWVRTQDRKPATVGRQQRFADHEVVQEWARGRSGPDEAVIGRHGSLGQMVRAMTTTSGSAIVPTVWLGDIIDRARNLSAVLRAGAEIAPMDAKTVQIGRLTTDPSAAFRTEGSPITPSDPVFDNVTLDSKTMSALVVGSLEWFMDANKSTKWSPTRSPRRWPPSWTWRPCSAA